MTGARVHASAEEVEFAWQQWVSEHGLPMRHRAGDYTTDLRADDRPVAAYVNVGRWVADCPRCRSGIACWPDAPRSCCLGCGYIYTNIVYPPARAVAKAEELLAERPEEHRNWHPAVESVDVLAAENEAHGYTPDAAASPETQLAREIAATVAGVDEQTVAKVLRAAQQRGGPLG